MANYNKGKIAIPNVTGNIVINIEAVQSAPEFTNLVPSSIGDDGVSVYNGTGYKNGIRFNSSFGESAAAGSAGTGYIPFDKSKTYRIRGMVINDTTASYIIGATAISGGTKYWTNAKASAVSFGYEYFKLDPKTPVVDANGDVVLWDGHNENGGNGWLKFQDTTFLNNMRFFRVSTNNDGANLIITANEPIE